MNLTDAIRIGGHTDIPEFKKTIAQKFHCKKKVMELLFGVPASLCLDKSCQYGLHGGIDILALDDVFMAAFPSEYVDGMSLEEFITAKYGKEICDWLRRNIDPVV